MQSPMEIILRSSFAFDVFYFGLCFGFWISHFCLVVSLTAYVHAPFTLRRSGVSAVGLFWRGPLTRAIAYGSIAYRACCVVPASRPTSSDELDGWSPGATEGGATEGGATEGRPTNIFAVAPRSRSTRMDYLSVHKRQWK